jgi:hypothetical protein
VPGSFTLNQQNVDESTILIFLKSPLPPFEVIQLAENVDYAVIPSGNTFEIRIFNLPPQFVLPGTYEFIASYSLLSGDFTLRTDSVGSNASVQLFDDLLTPYFSFVEISSDVLSGEFPGVPLDSTTYTTGLILHRGPVRARGEYQDVQWEAAPHTAWLGEVQLAAAIDPSMSVYASVAYVNKHYSQGTIVYYENVTQYTEDTVTGSASVQKQLYARNLFLSVGGSYSHIDGLVNSNGYSGNTSLVWKIGRLDVVLGANAYGSDSSGTGTLSTKRDHELVYLKLRRRIF